MAFFDDILDIRFIIGFLLFSLVIGIIIFRLTARQGWVDSFYNSSMILTAIGITDQLPSSTSKIFVALFAIYSAIVFLLIVSAIIDVIVERYVARQRGELIRERIA